MPDCIICAQPHSSSHYFTAREMMFGMRDTFTYFECEHCGTVQISALPENLSRYYPDTYYSYAGSTPKKIPLIKRFLKQQQAKFLLTGEGVIGRLAQKFFPYEIWIKNIPLNFDSKILDVGCGSGSLLLRFEHFGFKHLQGVDPFLSNDIFYDNGVKIFKKQLSEIHDTFDLIMFHHSLEHLPNPKSYLETAWRLLSPEGTILIRVPLAGTFAWKHYGVNWVQLDAPRHLFLPTVKSMHLLAEQSGFEIFKTEFDSTDFQFWGSEQYLKDIPLQDPSSYAKNPAQSIFSNDDISSFKARAEALNREGQGDQACFYLRKKTLT